MCRRKRHTLSAFQSYPLPFETYTLKKSLLIHLHSFAVLDDDNDVRLTHKKLKGLIKRREAVLTPDEALELNLIDGVLEEWPTTGTELMQSIQAHFGGTAR